MKINTQRTICLLTASFLVFGCNDQTTNANEQAQLPDDTAAAPSEKMTFSGQVQHPSPSGIEVNVKLGDVVVGSTTITQSDGSFTIEIDGLTGNELLSLEAVQQTDGLHMINVGDDLATFKAAATNGHIDGLKISPVSTAGYALATEMSNDGKISSRDEFNGAIANAHAVELVNVAVALTLITDGSNQFALPAEFDNSLEFALDMTNSVPVFLQSAEQQAPGIVSQTTETVFESSSEFSGFETDRDAGVYMNMDDLALYVLYTGSQGKVSFFNDDFPVNVQQWDVTDSGDLVVEYTNPDELDVIRPLQDSKSTIQTFLRRSSGNSPANLQPTTFDYYAFGGPLADANVTGDVWQLEGGYSAYHLDANGSGSLLKPNGDIIGDVSWLIAADGRLMIRETNGDQIIITNLVDHDAGNDALMVRVRPGGAVSEMKLVQLPQ